MTAKSLKSLIKSHLSKVKNKKRDQYTLVQYLVLHDRKGKYLYIYSNDTINDNFLGSEIEKLLIENKLEHVLTIGNGGGKKVFKIYVE